MEVAALLAFSAVERRARKPILPLVLFRNRNFCLITMLGFLLGFAMFGAMSLFLLYQQMVQGASGTNSGLLMLPMMAASMLVSLVVGQAITHTGRYRICPVIGGAVISLAMILLARHDAHTGRLATKIYAGLLGCGMGCLMQTTKTITQNSVTQNDLGVARSAAVFFRSIDGSFGMSLFGAVFNPSLQAGLTARFGAAVATLPALKRVDPAALQQVSADVRVPFIESLAEAISRAFSGPLIFTLLLALIAAFLREEPLRKSNKTAPTPEDAADIVAQDARESTAIAATLD